ncbi:DUF1801 domain-containing protein [Henriciella aquimarina]|uniref:DUF1801 domain-containing protein n=1 Tax=Henriciella aquimarina TaxID=545261 RepID=UPI0009FD0C8E|nr:DUF1801 domain-containing protein [Henriciella aquimarina]
MTKADNKTKPARQSPEDFIASVENETRRQDAYRLLALFFEATGLAPKMWGPSIIGYGRYHYKYESGREGDFMLTGFSPRKANLALYVLSGSPAEKEQLARLGKHKTGKACLYINKLADIHEDVLAEMIRDDVQYMRAKYETWEE